MNMKLLATLVLGGLGSVLCAQTTVPAEATLSSPVAKPLTVIANARPWHCTDQKCTGTTGSNPFDDERSCRDIAQNVGAVTAFRGERKVLSSSELSRCNKHARSSG